MKEGAIFPSITMYTWTGVRVKTYGEFLRFQARYKGRCHVSITLYTWTGVRVKTYGEFLRSQARCEGRREFSATLQAVPQHGPWDVRPTQGYPLKQTSKQTTIETCYTIGVSPITRYSLKQTSKQRTREACP